MQLRSFAVTDIGLLRSENEDACLCDDGLALYAVADGIGGLPGGAQASQRAVARLQEWFGAHRRDAEIDYTDALFATNQAVFILGRQISPRHGIGTTLTLAHFRDQKLHVTHVGDSALFRLRNGDFEALTSEHNLENEMRARAARGEPTIALQENRAALTRCVGQPPPLQGDHSEHEVVPADRYLVCTDGVTRSITPREIRQLLTNSKDPEEAAKVLVTLARERGGLDNATAVVVFVD